MRSQYYNENILTSSFKVHFFDPSDAKLNVLVLFHVLAVPVELWTSTELPQMITDESDESADDQGGQDLAVKDQTGQLTIAQGCDFEGQMYMDGMQVSSDEVTSSCDQILHLQLFNEKFVHDDRCRKTPRNRASYAIASATTRLASCSNAS